MVVDQKVQGLMTMVQGLTTAQGLKTVQGLMVRGPLCHIFPDFFCTFLRVLVVVVVARRRPGNGMVIFSAVLAAFKKSNYFSKILFNYIFQSYIKIYFAEWRAF